MITDNQITVHLEAAEVAYVQVPFDCQIGTVRATANGTIGASTVTLNDGTNDLGVATWTTALGVAAGKAAYVADTTYGTTKLSQNDVLTVTFVVTNAVAGACVQIDLDPYALS